MSTFHEISMEVAQFSIGAKDIRKSIQSAHSELRSATPSSRFGATVVVGDEEIEIQWLGFKAKATPRVVKVNGNKLIAEYVFTCQIDEETIRLCSFYLEGGFFSSDLEKKGDTFECCDVNALVVYVTKSMIGSTLFSPA